MFALRLCSLQGVWISLIVYLVFLMAKLLGFDLSSQTVADWIGNPLQWLSWPQFLLCSCPPGGPRSRSLISSLLPLLVRVCASSHLPCIAGVGLLTPSGRDCPCFVSLGCGDKCV